MEQPEPGAVGERRAGAFGGGAGVGEGRWVRSSCGHAPSVRPLRVLAHRYPPCADPPRADQHRADQHRAEPRVSTSTQIGRASCREKVVTTAMATSLKDSTNT